MIRASKSLDVQAVLSPDGLIAQSLPAFEARGQQVQMACAVGQALEKGRHLAVEAGTGIGKSFAYLVPALDRVFEKAGKVLVSTFTITLQEQLINNDLPFLADCLPRGFTAVLAKGRGNYICKRRLAFAARNQQLLFTKAGEELRMINNWANATEDGSLSDMPFAPSPSVWDAVRSEHGNCPGRRCCSFGDCFYRRARRRLENADIIVANHALMFSDLALKEQSVSLLPEYKFVVIDEAHNIERVAENHFGIDVSNYRLDYLLNGLHNPRTRKGLLAYKGKEAENAVEIVARVRRQGKLFFRRVGDWYEQARAETNGRCYVNFVDDNISGYLKELRLELAQMAKGTEDVDEKFEILRFADRSAALVQDVEDFLGQKKKDYVYWVEAAMKRRAAVRLRSAALNVGDDVKRCLFDKYQGVILTSATLSSTSADGKAGLTSSPIGSA